MRGRLAGSTGEDVGGTAGTPENRSNQPRSIVADLSPSRELGKIVDNCLLDFPAGQCNNRSNRSFHGEGRLVVGLTTQRRTTEASA